jgi:hypothetical protein
MSFGTLPDGTIEDFKLLKERYQVYGEARQKSDVLVVLDQGKVATDALIEKLTKRYGAPDVILGGTSNMILVEPKMVGETMIVPTSVQGNAVAQVDIELVGGTVKKSYKRVGIEDSLPEDPEVLKMVNAYEEPKIISVSSTPQTTGQNQQVNPQKGGYYSYQTCVSCHKSEYEQWKTTKHATALNTLEQEKRTLAECLPCHSEMFRKTDRTAKTPDNVGGVECASCHANVLPHGRTYKSKHDTAAISDSCKTCHTSERSPRFELNTYLDMVKHKK